MSVHITLNSCCRVSCWDSGIGIGLSEGSISGIGSDVCFPSLEGSIVTGLILSVIVVIDVGVLVVESCGLAQYATISIGGYNSVGVVTREQGGAQIVGSESVSGDVGQELLPVAGNV